MRRYRENMVFFRNSECEMIRCPVELVCAFGSRSPCLAATRRGAVDQKPPLRDAAMLCLRPLFAILAFSLTTTVLPVHGQGTAADYERASKLPVLVQKKVYTDRVNPHWLSDNRRFWYRNDLPGDAREFILVDAVKGERDLA